MEAVKNLINFLFQPAILISMAIVIFPIALRSRFVWTPKFAMILFPALFLFFGISTLDPNFRLIVTAPDNVPIVGLIFLMGFFVWYGIYRAKTNDARLGQGLPIEEAEENEKVLVWPNLVYTELICLIIATAILTVWAIGLKAPLEQPANPADSPNPSKAPWYFLGLQEMLVYFDPWLAGVVFPTLIIVGLMAIPFIDVNPKGSGYYSFKERKWEIGIFLFGFVILWGLLIVLGTFLRGPNWNFFGPYEFWDVHKVLVLNNVNLSEYFWVKLLGRALPSQWWIRESGGFLL
ncbi:MAG TPA: hypothetical protein VFG11_00885, partial [Acidobacteriota bacterium]|nr:hypothetical protein [Acidobacteriota bacterium]